MNFFVAKNQQRHGPYTEDEVRSRIMSGQFAKSDAGWHEGQVDWKPLSQLLVYLPDGPSILPPLPQKSSGLAKASFIIAMVGIGIWLILLSAAVIGVSSGAQETHPLMIIVGLLMFAGMAANLAGAVLGTIALTMSISNRWMAVAGLIANGLEIFGVVMLMVIGSAQR
ncbi:MAG: DUF4339 domain-containing protein [Verrucomicrobiota bacterium]|nr:DUF4339 domain-containing protein [Verrucomicrobiota bacterium]